jgi:hypothetical protein
VHDPSKWHELVERKPDGSIACTHGHEHKDNPHPLDGLFGPLAQEIDLPWHAMGAMGPEGHRTFNWSVIQNVPCFARFESQSFTTLRLETHVGSTPAPTNRFHSFLFQGQACDEADPGYQGLLSVGGNLDFGQLLIDTVQPALHIPLPTDAANPTSDARRLHGLATAPRYDLTWYGNNGWSRTGGPRIDVSLGVRREDWGPIDPTNPAQPLFYGGGQNGSWHEPAHLIAVYISPELDRLDGVADGYATYQGWTDRAGTIVTSCTAATMDCVPLRLDHMKVGHYQFRNDEHGIGSRDYDVEVNGASLITYPD